MEDGKIVDLFLEREETAIQCAREKYGSRLRMLSLGIVQDLQTAEECENDTYLEAWNRIPPRCPREYLYAFLARITRHISLNRCRSSNRLKCSAKFCQLSEEMEQCIPAPDDAVCRMEEEALGKAINQFLGTLDEEKRNIFIRRYWYLDSVETISKRFALSQSKVKTTLFRCRKKLRDYLEGEGYIL